MSGIVTVQTFTYYRIYPKDRIILKCLVMFLWFVSANQLKNHPQCLSWVDLYFAVHVLLHRHTLGCVTTSVDTFWSSPVLTSYSVLCSGDVIASNKLTWSWGVEVFFGTLIIAICEFFYTFRFHIISEGNWWITSVLIVLGLVQFISGTITLGLSSDNSLSGLKSAWIHHLLYSLGYS